MLFSLLPISAMAGTETTYPVWVAGIQVTESNMTDVLGTADGDAKTVTFDPQTNTLTLKSATVAATGTATGFGYGNNACGVKSDLEKLTVNLVGANQIGKEVTAESVLGDYSVDNGFSSTGDVAFTGDADSSLIIYDYCVGIQAKNVTFSESFKSKLTVRDSGGAEPQPPCAINAVGTFDNDRGDYIGGGNVNILGGVFDLTSYESNGIGADGSITVKNADLTVVADSTAIESSCGDVTIKNANIIAIGDTAINCGSGDILIDNVNLKAASDGCEGIYGGGEITITNCAKVDVFGADEALCASKTVSIICCPDVKLESNELNTISADDILIDNSTVAVTANHGYSGLIAIVNEDDDGDGSVMIKDSKVTIKAEGNGIRCHRFSVSGAKTEVYSVGDTDSDGKGCGAFIEGDESAISIVGSTVKLTGGEAGIKLQMESSVNPFAGSLPNVRFTGNAAFDTFTSMQDVSYKSEEGTVYGTFSECSYVGNEMAKSVMMTHTHDFVKVDGVMATTKNAGFKSYYKCACGKFFEDAAGLIEITDIEKWKAAGGNGYLPQIAEQNKQEQTDPQQKSPKNGDTTHMAFWIMMLIVSFMGFVTCFIFNRKIVR